MRFGAAHGFPCGENRQDVPHAVVAVDHRYRARVYRELGLRHRIHYPIAYAIQVPAETQHAMGLMAPQIRLH